MNVQSLTEGLHQANDTIMNPETYRLLFEQKQKRGYYKNPIRTKLLDR